MIIIAHRGANREALENSWDAFEKAVDAGAAMIEFDVHLTRDGEIVVAHDHDLFKVTGEHCDVRKLKRSDIESRRLLDGSLIPFLKEVLNRFLPCIQLNIEIKGSSVELAKAVGNMVSSHSGADKVIISSFGLPPLEYLAYHEPHLKRAFLCGGDHSWRGIKSYAPNIYMDELNTNILHPCCTMVNENLMDQAKSRGWIVNAWVPMDYEEENREAFWTAMQTLGVDGLCTNYPRQLKRWFEEVETNATIFSRIEKDLANRFHRS